MTDLSVIDLASQAREVANHIKGRKSSDVLAWLRQYGEIAAVHPDNPNAYIFRSHSGATTGFIIEEGGLLSIIGDHKVVEVPSE
jgi:hypothetical protein